MRKEELANLIQRVADNTASDEDLRKYNAWCNVQQESSIQTPDFLRDQEKVLSNIYEAIGQSEKRRFIPFRRIAAAASILLFLSTGAYLVFIKYGNKVQSVTNTYTQIVPGGNKAILTLANGKTINLTNALNGVIAQETGAKVKKTAEGQVVYDYGKDAANAASAGYNTIATPAGGQYQVTLSDGSKVWLNAQSSLRYPVAFKGKERDVELLGEAYFEVAHNKRMPFRVISAGQKIEVLGTHFNVNTYHNEPSTKTTLLEGSVKVYNNSKQFKILKPGQQSTLYHNALSVSEANTEEATAWKNGYFRFNDEKIESIMRKVARWYNVDVAYQGNVSDEEYNGRISRAKNIGQVLDMLTATKTVRFKIEGRRITVMN